MRMTRAPAAEDRPIHRTDQHGAAHPVSERDRDHVDGKLVERNVRGAMPRLANRPRTTAAPTTDEQAGGDEVHVRHAVPNRQRRRPSREEHGQDLVGDAARSHRHPGRQADQHIAQNPQEEGWPGSQRALAAAR